jgi:hypothetical protein
MYHGGIKYDGEDDKKVQFRAENVWMTLLFLQAKLILITRLMLFGFENCFLFLLRTDEGCKPNRRLYEGR